MSSYTKMKQHIENEIVGIKEAGTYKSERILLSSQDAEITVGDKNLLNFCANNYLGLSSHPRLIEAAKKGLDSHGFGMSSVRFICGTQDLHKELEDKISNFFKTEDTILYASCFDANGGVFEPLLDAKDAIISDSLNHASIIDGVRLCKAQRFRYKNSDMEDLEEQLKAADGCRFKLIVSDGVFSMDGYVAKLDKIVKLAEKYDAMVMLDESHSAGVIGKGGRGTTEYYNLMGKIDIITGTLGKAFGGAIGGFTTAKKEIVDILRQRSRPYLFSNSLLPSVVQASIEAFTMLEESNELQDKLHDNIEYFVSKLEKIGLDYKKTESAIIAVMLYDAKLSQDFANKLLDEGVYVIGFNFPVVPKGEARIRVQISAAHSKEDIDKTITAFEKVGKMFDVIK